MTQFISRHRAVVSRCFLPLLILVAASLALALASANLADDPPPEPFVSDAEDMDGDEVTDIITADSSSEEQPGEVVIESGDNGQIIVTFQGQSDGDRFGYSVAVIDDLNLDGEKDLIIGAPRDGANAEGRAYVFYGPFTESGPTVISAENADMTFRSPDEFDYHFGERVGAVSDVNGDGVTDLRMLAWFDEAQQPPDPPITISHTYVVSGLTGAPLFLITGSDPFDPWAIVPGDVDGDGDVDQADEDIVLANLGTDSSEGDLNGDGIVDGLDLAIVLGNMNTNHFQVLHASSGCPNPPPPGYHCVLDCTHFLVLVPVNVEIECRTILCPGCFIDISPSPPPMCQGDCLSAIQCVFSKYTFTSPGDPYCCISDRLWSVPCGLMMKYWSNDDYEFSVRLLSLGSTCLKCTRTSCGHVCLDQFELRSVWIDSDEDGLPDALEETLFLNPFDPDTDNDGILDGHEDAMAFYGPTGLTNLEQLASGTWPGLWSGTNSAGTGSVSPGYQGLVGSGSVATGVPQSCNGCENQINGVLVDGDWVSITPGEPLYVCPGSRLVFHSLHTCGDGEWITTGPPGPPGGPSGPPVFGPGGSERWSSEIIVPGGGESGGGGECGNHFYVGYVSSAACVDMLQVVPTCVDVDVDSDNDDGFQLPNGDEDGIEDDETLPGKLVLINKVDRDGDGIPGFADGFDYLESIEGDDTSQGDQFIPLRLKVFGVDLSVDHVVIEYDDSPPAELAVTNGPNGPEYSAAPGTLRIWRKNGNEARNKASISDGGDFVPPGEHSAALLGLGPLVNEVVLWVEAVAPSASLADARIRISVDNCESSDAIRLSAYGTQFVRADDIQLAGTDVPSLSHPTPIVAAAQLEFTNVRTTSDKTKVLADLIIAGTVDDALSDLLPGPQGIIDELYVRLNGAPATVLGSSTPIVLPITHTKATSGNTLLKPYDYSGQFSQVITNLEIQPGWNTVQLVALNERGYSGFAERAFELRPNPPPDVNIDLWMQFYDEETLAVELQVNGVVPLFTVLYLRIAPGVYEDPTNPGSIIQVPPGLNPDLAETFIARLTHPPDDLSDVLITVTRFDENQPIFDGTRLLEEQHRIDWTGYTFDLDAVTGFSASNGGAFHPFLIEVVGPSEVAGLVVDMTFTSQFENAEGQIVNWQRTYNTVELLQRRFLALPGNDHPEVMLAMPSQTAGETLQEVHGEWREGTWHFIDGFGRGFIDTGVDIVDSVGAVSKLWWYAQKNYNPLTILQRLNMNGSLILEEDQQRFTLAWETAKAIGTIASQLHDAHHDLFYAVLTGDEDTLNALGEQYRLTLEFAVELFEAIDEATTELDDYEIGRIAGRVTSEVAIEVGLALTTAGTGNVAKKSATMVNVINKLDNLPNTTIPPVVKAKFGPLTTYLSQMATTKMCFVAGTLVHTAHGLMPIEQIQVGDMALSRDPATGEQGYKPVLETFVTHPDALYHMTYALKADVAESGPAACETLIGTGEHPFYVVGVDDFLPMRELKIGDRLLTAGGASTAYVTDIQIERGPPGESFTTYNFEVADWHTYFVGGADSGHGVWVHNAAKQPCERVFAIFERIKIREALAHDPVEALKRTLQKFEGVNAGRKLNSETFRSSCLKVMDDLYQNPPMNGGVIDFEKLSYTRLHNALQGNLLNNEVEIHHICQKKWAKRLYQIVHGNDAIPPQGWNSWLDSMPSVTLPKKVHNYGASDIPGTSTWHDIELGILPGKADTYLDPDEILSGLSEIWTEFNVVGSDADIDFMNMWNIGEQWLRQQLPELFP